MSVFICRTQFSVELIEQELNFQIDMHKMYVFICRTQFSVELIEQELNFKIDMHKMYVFIYRTQFSVESIEQELNFKIDRRLYVQNSVFSRIDRAVAKFQPVVSLSVQ